MGHFRYARFLMYPIWLPYRFNTRHSIGAMVPNRGIAKQGINEPSQAQSECDKSSSVMKVVIRINSKSY
jgi:hypothetical protein